MPVVWVVALVAVGLRLPLLSRPPSPDEAGFLLVGGAVAQRRDVPVRRLLGRSAAPADHPLPHRRRRRRSGAAAAPRLRRDRAHHPRCRARSLVGSAVEVRPGGRHWPPAHCCVSPLTGAQSVNGELLAAPFVIWGIVAAVHAAAGRPPRHAPRRCRGCCPRLLGDGQAELRGRRRVRGRRGGHSRCGAESSTRGSGAQPARRLRPRRGRRDGLRLRLDAGQRHLPRRRVRRDVPLPSRGGPTAGVTREPRLPGPPHLAAVRLADLRRCL